MSSSRRTFFRQGGWLVLATVLSGAFMFAVNLVANRMDSAEFVVFRKLLAVFLIMSFPTTGLQLIFAEQTSAASTPMDRRQLAHAARAALRGTFFIWLGMAGIVLVAQRKILSAFEITQASALWTTVLIGLWSLWLPIVRGLLQGAQNFVFLGLVALLDGIGRFTAVTLIVLNGGQAAGGMAGACLGQIVALSFGAWATRRVWTSPGDPMLWRPWFSRVVPLTLTFSSVLLMTCADVLFVGATFPNRDAQFYVGAQIIGVALVMLTTPLAAVMFPKIVASAARVHRTDALQLALGASVAITGLGALACTIMPELPLRILFFRKPEFWRASILVPWFAWALLPLILTNVLVNNLVARGQLRIAPWLIALALGYLAVLLGLRERLLAMELFSAFKTIIGTLGAFNFFMLVTAVIFTRRALPAVAG